MNTTALRTLIIYAIILPLAVLIGWMAVDLAHWDQTSFSVIAAIVFVLLIPALLKWHYEVMVLSWSTFITIFFLPGKPSLWMLMAAVNCGIAVLHRILQKRRAFISTPSISLALVAILAVTVTTAQLRGGFGLNILGSSTVGGKPYYFIIAAILGYFAFASQRIPVEKAKLYVGLFFLGGLATAVSNLIYFAGPSFYFLYLIFPAGFAAVQATSEAAGPGSISRIAGFSVAATSAGLYVLAVNGIRGIVRKWWKIGLLLLVLAAGMMGGYRSALIFILMILMLAFIAEGLLRSPLFPALLLAGGLAFAALIPIAPRLPFPVQRTLSFLPIQVNPIVQQDADASINWRLEMWRALTPEFPKYFWLGKGYAKNMTDLYLTEQAILRHRAPQYQQALLSGDYHSGPLSVYIPFGVFGCLALFIFIALSLRALWRNYKYGPEQLRVINRFLLVYFLGRTLFFLSVFGAFAYDFYLLTGVMGLSVALNGGVCRKPVSISQPVTFRERLTFDGGKPAKA